MLSLFYDCISSLPQHFPEPIIGNASVVEGTELVNFRLRLWVKQLLKCSCCRSIGYILCLIFLWCLTRIH